MLSDADVPTDRVRVALDGYAETLRRRVTATLLKPRNTIPVEELTDRILAALANPPAIDRRILDLPPASRCALAVLGLTRQPRWKLGHLITVLAAVGHAEGTVPVRLLFESGLLYPDRTSTDPLVSFEGWFEQSSSLDQYVFADPSVAGRARGVDFDLPDLTTSSGGTSARIADGLEWPLRLAAVAQVVAEQPMRRTQATALFKRDLTRLQTHELLAAAPSDHLAVAPDAGVLALFWAASSGHLQDVDGELRCDLGSPTPSASVFDTLSALVAGLCHVEAWDPLLGYHASDGRLSPFPSATVCIALLLAKAKGWVSPAALAEWLWEHHPSWQGVLSKEAQKEQGRAWVEAYLFAVAYPLRLIEVLPDGAAVRLSDVGKHLFAAGPRPAEPPAFPQTLLVQPNAEILAYRQGLTPDLIHKLTRFARWKSLGPACTLDLTAEQTYRGLESGLTLAGIVQTLNQHGTRSVPTAVAELLQRWANKRERISIYAAATLVEFLSAADLDAAIARGIVAIRLTDRIGLCGNGTDPDFKHLRLIGNREYDARPSRCVSVADDGVTLTVDAGQSDLLLEAEIGRLTEPLPSTNDVRQFRLTTASLGGALRSGWSLEDVDSWFVNRTGFPLSAVGRLFVRAPQLPPSLASKRMILQVSSSDAADGLMQWPTTRALLEDRLGPTALTVDEQHLPALIAVLKELGLQVDVG